MNITNPNRPDLDRYLVGVQYTSGCDELKWLDAYPGAISAAQNNGPTSTQIGSLQPMVKAGTARIIGLATEKRISAAPEVPTMREQGINAVSNNWYAIVGPKGMTNGMTRWRCSTPAAPL